VVLVGARDEGRGRVAAEQLSQEGADARFVRLDVTKPDTIEETRDRIDRQFGRLDILVNNAGVSLEQAPEIRGVPSAVPVEVVRRTFETNVFGVIAVTNAMLPLLRRAPAGRIVNVSSTMGSLTAWADPASPLRRYAPVLIAYDSSKAALNATTLHYAAELAQTSIKVNAASPGYVATDLNQHRGTLKLEDEESAAAIVRLATLDEDGPTGAFLSSEGPATW
jgi:NAD(P)-dependent dehydrogenase (short-subunit alcohol dehydrogenase family)